MSAIARTGAGASVGVALSFLRRDCDWRIAVRGDCSDWRISAAPVGLIPPLRGTGLPWGWLGWLGWLDWLGWLAWLDDWCWRRMAMGWGLGGRPFGFCFCRLTGEWARGTRARLSGLSGGK